MSRYDHAIRLPKTDENVASINTALAALGVPDHLRIGARPWLAVSTWEDNMMVCPRCKGEGELALVGGGSVKCRCDLGTVGYRTWTVSEEPMHVAWGDLVIHRDVVLWMPQVAGFLLGDFPAENALPSREAAQARVVELQGLEVHAWLERWYEEGIESGPPVAKVWPELERGDDDDSDIPF